MKERRELLGLDEMARVLAPFDLKPRRVRALDAGTVNAVYRVDTDGGAVFVRVNQGKSEADVRYEAALLWHLGARRFPTPQPLRRGDGMPYVVHCSKYLTVFPWVAGEAVDEARITVEHAARIGVLLGRLHRAAADFAPRRDGIYTFERIAARWDGIRADPRVAPIAPLVDEEVAWLRASRLPSTSGTIHGDLFADNVLWQGPSPIALDFEQASTGRYAYDLAVTLLAWCWDGADLDEARTRALAGGYASQRPLDDGDRAALYAESRFAALRFTVTRLTDVHLPNADRPGKDYRDYLARLQRLREMPRDRFETLLLSGSTP